jgi:hypothetical protein
MAYDLLDSVKVVELSMYAFAPASAAVLADLGGGRDQDRSAGHGRVARAAVSADYAICCALLSPVNIPDNCDRAVERLSLRHAMQRSIGIHPSDRRKTKPAAAACKELSVNFLLQAPHLIGKC